MNEVHTRERGHPSRFCGAPSRRLIHHARRIASSVLLSFAVAGSASPAFAAGESPAPADDASVLLPSGQVAETVVGEAALDLIHNLFIEYDPDYLANIAIREQRLDALAERLFARTAGGFDTRCSRQIFLEAKWLVGYTAWWSRIDARLDDLEASFDQVDQSFAAEPSPEDGFYGRCAETMFIRIEDTLVNYFDLAGDGTMPSVEHVPLPELRTKEGLTSFLTDRLVSDIPNTGEDLRSRFGSLVSIFAAADRRDSVMELASSTVRGAQLTPGQLNEQRLHFNYLVSIWQEPGTGYWGAWYRDGNQVFKTTDLSITYHIVHARRGEVQYWPELIRTTFAIREQDYPFGWLSDGHWTNHNNYDLARMFRYGWPHMTEAQRDETARTLQDMIDWSFAETVLPGYQGFLPDPQLSSSLESEFYFGASFLVAAGFFEAEPWYGAIERPAPPREVCLGMTGYGQTLEGPLVAGALDKLAEACKPHLP